MATPFGEHIAAYAQATPARSGVKPVRPTILRRRVTGWSEPDALGLLRQLGGVPENAPVATMPPT
jgi:hypothetical protein